MSAADDFAKLLLLVRSVADDPTTSYVPRRTRRQREVHNVERAKLAARRLAWAREHEA